MLFETSAHFVEWLSRQVPDAKGAWLRFAKRGSGLVTLTKAEAIDAAICHGWIDGQLDKYDERSWLIRFTPRKPGSKWSQVNRTRALELIAEGRMAALGVEEVEAAKADGRWDAAMRLPARLRCRRTCKRRSTPTRRLLRFSQRLRVPIATPSYTGLARSNWRKRVGAKLQNSSPCWNAARLFTDNITG